MKHPSILNRVTAALLIFAGAVVFGFRQQATLGRLRQREAELKNELAGRQAQRSVAEAEAATRKRELAEQAGLRDVETARMAKMLHQNEATMEALRWAEPPAQVPDWNPASPYIWLRKESLPSFPVPVFDDAGRLGSEAASVLAVPRETLRLLNGKLSGLFKELQEAEAGSAELSNEHLPDVSQGNGRKLTVRIHVLPEVGSRLRRDFEATLREHLGEGRAELLQRTASHWLDSHFRQTDSEPRVLSVLQRDDGTYHIVVKSAPSYISVGGQRDLNGYVPAHLRPMFAPLMEAPVNPDDGAP